MKKFINFIQESDTSHAFSLEEKLAKHLKRHGAMDKSVKAAGSSGGHDFHILHPNSKEKVGGVFRETIHGETKKSIAGAKLGRVKLKKARLMVCRFSNISINIGINQDQEKLYQVSKLTIPI
jgi:hypothetical protein